MSEGMLDPMPEVKVQLSNGEEKILFSYYPDEISFKESEFIGLKSSVALFKRYLIKSNKMDEENKILMAGKLI